MDAAATRPARAGAGTIIAGLALAAAIAILLDTAVAAIARAAGASDDFAPLDLPIHSTFTVLGLLLGAAGWAVVRARSANPRAVLRVLVPVVLVLSFVPDLLVGAGDQIPGTSWVAVIALVVMHLVVAAAAVPTYLRVLPLPPRA